MLELKVRYPSLIGVFQLMHYIIRGKVYLHLTPINDILGHLRAAELIEHGQLNVRVLAKHILLLVKENHIPRFPLLLWAPSTYHDKLLIILDRGAEPVDWGEVFYQEEFPLLVNRFFIKVKSFYALLSEGIY